VDSDAAVTVVEALDLTTGQRHPWKSLMPPDSTGVAGIFNIRFAASGEGYVYTYASLLSELYLATDSSDATRRDY